MKDGFTFRKCEGCWDWRKRERLLGSTKELSASHHQSCRGDSYEDTSSSLTHTNRLHAGTKDFSQSLRSFTGKRSPTTLTSPRQGMIMALTAPQVYKGHAVIPLSLPIDYYALSLKRHFERTVERSVLNSTGLKPSTKPAEKDELSVSQLQCSRSCANCSYLLCKGFSARHCSLHSLSSRP